MDKNKEIGSRIRQRRTEMNMTQEELGKKLGLNKSTIQRYEIGTIASIKLPILQAMAEQLCVNPDWLALKTDVMERKETPQEAKKHPELTPVEYNPTHRIPVLGRISAGLPLYAEENIEEYIYTELNGGNEYFGLRVEGDSMNAARICEGDIIIVRQQEQVEDGEIAVVMVGDENATVKRFHREGGNVFLSPQSFNPANKVQVYDLKETNIRIVGKVVQVVYRME